MAIWTYKAVLAPKNKITENSTYADIFDGDIWLDLKIDFSIEKGLSKYHKEITSWSKHRRVWKTNENTTITVYEDDENSISILYENEITSIENNILMILLKLDLRKMSIDILNTFISLANKLDSYVVSDLYGGVSGDFHILNPNIEDVIEDIKISRAYDFISDPDAFLDKIVKQKRIKNN